MLINVEFELVLFVFYCYCFIGWIWESCYESVLNKKLLNRGFLNGPYIPLYGFGGVFGIVFLQKYQADFLSSTTLKVYIISMIAATILEYITSYFLEKVLHARWWDYSNYPLNLNGRICLIASLFWGLVGVLVVNVLNPFIINLKGNITHDGMLIFLTAFTTVFILDIIVTINSILELNDKLQLFLSMETDKLVEILSDKKIDLTKYKLNVLTSNPFMNRIVLSFPNLKFNSDKVQKTFVNFRKLLFRKDSK